MVESAGIEYVAADKRMTSNSRECFTVSVEEDKLSLSHHLPHPGSPVG